MSQTSIAGKRAEQHSIGSRLRLCAALGCLSALPALAQPSAKDMEWPTYAADLASTRYRPLDQINASNFNDLEVVWRFKTDMLGIHPEYKLEGTPLMVKGVLYTTGGTRRAVVALDA